MRASKLLIVILFIFAMSSVIARSVRVVVSYGNHGSQGLYACFLYKDYGSWTWKYLTNSGFGTGSAQFDGLPAGTYQARIVCVTAYDVRWTNAQRLFWWWENADLRASF